MRLRVQLAEVRLFDPGATVHLVDDHSLSM